MALTKSHLVFFFPLDDFVEIAALVLGICRRILGQLAEDDKVHIKILYWVKQ